MSSSSSCANSRSGNVRELFSFHCAAVTLMDYDEERTARFIRVGEFTVNLLVQATQHYSILMCACVLGELQWPLAKNAPVIRIGLRAFVFAVPGLLYGLQFPPSCSAHVMDTLERVFLKFGHYEDTSHVTGGYPSQDHEPQFWQRMRLIIEPLAHSALSKLGHVPGRSPWTAAHDVEHSGLVRALRVSATTKMISRDIIAGSVKAIHINIHEAKTPTTCKSEEHEIVDNNIGDDRTIYASINVFTDLVDAMEIAWMVASSADHHSSDQHLLLKKKKSDDNGHLVFVDDDDDQKEGLSSAWKWNKQGIIAFMKELKSAEEVEEKRLE